LVGKRKKTFPFAFSIVLRAFVSSVPLTNPLAHRSVESSIGLFLLEKNQRRDDDYLLSFFMLETPSIPFQQQPGQTTNPDSLLPMY
jgi:hypothetical protein